jgi:hypothetical protein
LSSHHGLGLFREQALCTVVSSKRRRR